VDLKLLMQELLDELGKVAKADAVVGGVRDAGKAKILPLAKISVGFGTAMGSLDGKAQRGKQKGLDELSDTHDHCARIRWLGRPRDDALGDLRQRDRSAPRGALRGNMIEYSLLGVEAEH
jgi:hypothetical protein